MNLHNLFESSSPRANFNIGDPVIITGNVEFRGKTGDVREFGRDGAFVVVDLYNYGPRSFHVSDVSYNDYADEEDAEDVVEGELATYLVRVMDAATGEHWRIEVKVTSPEMAKERAEAMGYKVLGVEEKGVAEGKEDKIKQLRQDYATAVHWSKNETSPQKREAARQKAEKIKRHLETQYKQGVAEGFDQPYPLKWEKSEYGDIDALAKLPDGSPLSIMFNLADQSENNWGVEFYRNNSQAATGEGDAQRVFATVLAAIGQFIKKKKPDTLFFTSVKEEDPTGSRAKLYDRLVQRYAAGLEYDLKKVDYPEQTGYKLTRKEQGVAEGYDSEELANEVYAEFERMYPNLARRANERTVHAAIMDVLNYGGDNDPAALAQDVARAVKIDIQGVAEEKAERNDQPWVDPKLKRKMDYAFGHYAGYRDRPEAFFKWIMNSIDHSEENDLRHDERFDRIEQEIEQLSQRLNQINEQHGSAVANRFSQRLAERFAADHPTADPARSLFVESRAAKRAAIRKILSSNS